MSSFRGYASLLLLISLSQVCGYVLPPKNIRSSSSSSSSSSIFPRRSTKEDLTYDREAWMAGFSTCTKETAAELLEGSGTLPLDLEGTYFRNGHAKFEVGKELIKHPFDADGMISAVSIKDGKALFRNRFVSTKGYKKEAKFKKILYRGAFGTQREGGMFSNIFDIKNKNVANTNVVYWAGRLLALWEGGLPHLMEADSLRTLGEYKFKGLLKTGDTFSAHPRAEASTGRLINFSAAQGGKSCAITIYEFMPGAEKELSLAAQRTFEVPGFVFFHDFIVTKNYYIFNQAPVDFNAVPFLLGQRGPAECITYAPSRPAMLYLVPRDGVSPVVQVPVDAHFNFHFANGFEEEDGKVVFDVVKCDNMLLGVVSGNSEPIWKTVDYGKEVPFSTLVRYTLTPSNSEKSAFTCTTKTLSKTQVDFTSVSPFVSCSKHRYVYASSGSDSKQSSPVQGVIKIDTQQEGKEDVWIGQKHEFLGENIFVPKKGAVAGAGQDEDDGYVLSFLFNGRTKSTEFVAFDAKNIKQGPIARLPLPTLVPFGLHGSFVPGLTFNNEDVIRRHTAVLGIDSKQWNAISGGFSGIGLKYEIEGGYDSM